MRPSLLAAFLVCTLSVQADPLDPAPAANYARLRSEQQAVANGHSPWVWEARLGNSTVWLVGCIHLGMEGDMNVYPNYLPYYQKADRVYFEIAPRSMDTYEVRRVYQRRGYLQNRQTLESVIPDELWKEMRRTLEPKPELFARMAVMEPWLAAFELTHLNYERAGLNRSFGLEEYLVQQASHDRKPVGGLEQAKDQVLAFADSPPGDQNAFLRSALRSFAGGDRTALAVRKAWVQSDDAGLRKQLGVNLPREDPTLHENLIAGRNQKWVQRIQEISGKGKATLFVVGVEHLVGGESDLPTLLTKQGYTVRRVGKN